MNVNVDLMKKSVIQINGGIMINVDVSVKNVMYVKKKYVRNPATCNCKNGKYLASFMDDSAITNDEVIESYNEDQKLSRTTKQIFIKRKQPVKHKIFIFYLYFY